MPSPAHGGFLIPNAAGVSNPRMAEPDQIDFNILGHMRWGVVEDCAVTVAANSASAFGGVYVCNGVLLNLHLPASVPITTGDAQDRFDLIVGDDAGNLNILVGSPDADPVFPDVPLNRTVFAAVFVSSTGGSPLSTSVIDKRKMLNKALLTKVSNSADLVRNLNGTGDLFRIDGAGSMSWLSDNVKLWRVEDATLRVRKHLQVENDLRAHRVVYGEDTIAANGRITGSNLQMGTSFPVNAPGTGSVFQDEGTGKVFVRQGNAWEELATTRSANPVGTVITSLQGDTTLMKAMGWYPLNGSTISESNPLEASAFLSLSTVITPIGTAPLRIITLPNFSDRMMMCSFATAPGTLGGANSLVLRTNQMPLHRHIAIGATTRMGGSANPTGSTGRAGGHLHATSGGAHPHDVDDPEHRHNGTDHPQGHQFVSLAWGGKNKVDALFNDRNHTYSVEAADWTQPARSGVTVRVSGAHGHTMDPAPDHDHTVTINPIPPHDHIIDEAAVGGSDPIDIKPAYVTVYAYIRS